MDKTIDHVTRQAVALSGDIAAGDAHPVEVDGAELVLWRDNEGKAHLWQDRCPHRGMRLSFGFVRDNRLTCLYHGWEFGTDGGCRKIPAHPEMAPPATLCAEVLPVSEAMGMIFAGPHVEIGVISDTWYPVRSVFLSCEPEAALDALKDVSWRKIDGVHLFEDGTLACAVQRRGTDRCVLHLSTTDPSAEARLRWARRLVGLRRMISEGEDRWLSRRTKSP
ncbi:Rieske (2Fe-2S) protein [Gymnodinialimonas sp. 2305UL16-5]|uniref:Rieske (2Fe-2S) protein n=1 Tax=Gymnodinialimonas mytili TaxID=3126503 RepID=UPI0030A3B44A